MERLSLTSFGRQPVSAGLIASLKQTSPKAAEPVSKWQVLRDVTTSRKALGLSDRALTVLTALLSFHQGDELHPGKPLIVFPSNRTLCGRAHGMAESTLRRHLAALVESGLIRRHDSPNGKRYRRHGPGGSVVTAFGFDLSPLTARAEEFSETAQAMREHDMQIAAMRERCVLMLRDAVKLVEFGREGGTDFELDDALDACRRHLRRKPTVDGLNALEADLSAILTDLKRCLDMCAETEEVNTCDVQNERHQQRSDTEDLDSGSDPIIEQNCSDPTLPLPVVLEACPEFQLYSPDPIKRWRDLVSHAEKISRMMGIGEDAWKDACQMMGACNAGITIACILERMGQIGTPGGYLRKLTRKAADGSFSAGSMVMAEMKARNARVV